MLSYPAFIYYHISCLNTIYCVQYIRHLCRYAVSCGLPLDIQYRFFLLIQPFLAKHSRFHLVYIGPLFLSLIHYTWYTVHDTLYTTHCTWPCLIGIWLLQAHTKFQVKNQDKTACVEMGKSVLFNAVHCIAEGLSYIVPIKCTWVCADCMLQCYWERSDVYLQKKPGNQYRTTALHSTHRYFNVTSFCTCKWKADALHKMC